jgi:hypothetical protein
MTDALFPVRILHIPLMCDGRNDDADLRIVESLRPPAISGFTHGLLSNLNRHDVRFAQQHPAYKNAVYRLRANGLLPIHCRWLWTLADGPAGEFFDAHKDPVYIAARVAAIIAESDAVGALSAVDPEPYAKAPVKRFKGVDIPQFERQAIIEAVVAALFRTGMCDYVLDSCGGRSSGLYWLTRLLGRAAICEKTYYALGPEAVLDVVTAPGMGHDLHIWGSNVGLGRPEDMVGGDPRYTKLTAAQFRALDFAAIKSKYPQCKGFMAYIDRQIFPEVLAQW